MRIQSLLHPVISRIFGLLGYKIVRSHRLPVSTIDPFDLGIRFFLNKEVIRIIQVGANDGVTNDPFYKWAFQIPRFQGVLIEPYPPAFQRLIRNYEHTPSDLLFFNAAASDFDGTIDLYFPDEAGIDTDSQKCSVSQNHIVQHGRSRCVKPLSVPCYTLKSIVEKFDLQKIDILLIDAEGYDWVILDRAFDDLIAPDMIMLESLHLSKNAKLQMRKRLTQLDYLYIETTKDVLALKRGVFETGKVT